MNNYNVVYEARLVGAIGVFYPKHVLVENSPSETEAWETAFELLHASGYETRGRIKCEEHANAGNS